MTKRNDEQPAAPFYRRVTEVIRDPAEWQDFEQVDIDLLDGSEIVVHDVMFLRGDYERADPDFAVVLFAGPEDGIDPVALNGRPVPVNARTTSCGGAVFVRKLKMLSAYKDDAAASMLPILGRVVRRQSRAAGKPQPYYDFAG